MPKKGRISSLEKLVYRLRELGVSESDIVLHLKLIALQSDVSFLVDALGEGMDRLGAIKLSEFQEQFKGKREKSAEDGAQHSLSQLQTFHHKPAKKPPTSRNGGNGA